MRFAAAIASLVVGAALVPAAGSAASTAPPPDQSAIEQYIEQVPTSGGPRDVIASRGGHRAISASTAQNIQAKGGVDAGLLQAAATATEYGVPTSSGSTGAGASAAGRSTIGAAVGAVSDVGNNSIADVFAALIGVSLVSVFLVAAQRRRR